MWVPIKLSDIGSIAKLRFSQTMHRMTTPCIRCGFATISVKKDRWRQREEVQMMQTEFVNAIFNFRLGLQLRDVVLTNRKWQHSIFWAPQVERNFFVFWLSMHYCILFYLKLTLHKVQTVLLFTILIFLVSG